MQGHSYHLKIKLKHYFFSFTSKGSKILRSLNNFYSFIFYHSPLGLIYLSQCVTGWPSNLTQISHELLCACCMALPLLARPSSLFFPSPALPLCSWLYSPRKPTLIDPSDSSHSFFKFFFSSSHLSLYFLMFYFVENVPIDWFYFIWTSLWRKH